MSCCVIKPMVRNSYMCHPNNKPKATSLQTWAMIHTLSVCHCQSSFSSLLFCDHLLGFNLTSLRLNSSFKLTISFHCRAFGFHMLYLQLSLQFSCSFLAFLFHMFVHLHSSWMGEIECFLGEVSVLQLQPQHYWAVSVWRDSSHWE